MTEHEWQNCTDPKPMLEFIRGKASDRKLRLFAVACCRRIARLLPGGESDEAVLVMERFADGDASKNELSAACGLASSRASEAIDRAPPYSNDIFMTNSTFSALENALSHPDRVVDNRTETMVTYATWSAERAAEAIAYADLGVASDDWRCVFRDEKAVQAGLLRCIFGNPFRPLTLDPAWLTWHDGLLVSMARQMYDSRDFSDMPILADALEEAGCANADILVHLRGPGPHVRGCWVVDLLLGKE
jgi:hypothetical protein